MPPTPYHLGPGLLLGIILIRFLDLPTFLIANLTPDLEPFFVYSLGVEIAHHGIVHSFFGGGIAAIILTGIMFIIRPLFNPVMSFFRLEQERSFKKILMASFIGIYLHILFDAPTHNIFQPFYPLEGNPFLGSLREFGISLSGICIYLFLSGLIVYLIRLTLYYWRGESRKIYLASSSKFSLKGASLILVGTFCIIKVINDELPWYSNFRMANMVILISLLPIMIITIIFDFIYFYDAFKNKRQLNAKKKNWNYNCVECRIESTLAEETCIKCTKEIINFRYVLWQIENSKNVTEEKKTNTLSS
ncbi:MAG: metal-dependent hydrolase [Candidatus Thorarchaeota archaeon]